MKSNGIGRKSAIGSKYAVNVNSDNEKKKTIGSIHAVICNLLKGVGVVYWSSCRSPWSGFVRILFVELLNELQGVLQVVSTYPGEFLIGSFIPCPPNIVADGNSTTTIRLGVKDFPDFKFEFTLSGGEYSLLVSRFQLEIQERQGGSQLGNEEVGV